MTIMKSTRWRLSISIALAWLTVPVIGLILLFITTQSSTISASLIQLGEDSDIGISALNGLLGIILILLLVILTHQYRQSSYFRHLRIGLFIGLGIYSLLLAVGIGLNLKSSSDWSDPTACNSARQQYTNNGAAIIPIATDKGFGTGFAVSDPRTVLTAYHVVEAAESITANYSSGSVEMEVLDTAPQYDLALLRLSEPADSFFKLSESYSIGERVYVYGYPGNALYAGAPSLSAGIISRVITIADLRLTAQSAPNGLEILQTDAAINPGNSGGPLIANCGVVGVVSFLSDTSELGDYIGSVSEQNIGYAVSAKTAKAAFPKYLDDK